MELPGTEQEVNRMCNLGEALYEDAKQEGIELGLEQGIELKSKEIITNMYKKGMDEEYVRKILLQ